jgi:hypothetical protein
VDKDAALRQYSSLFPDRRGPSQVSGLGIWARFRTGVTPAREYDQDTRMRLLSLSLQNFRNIAEASLTSSRGRNSWWEERAGKNEPPRSGPLFPRNRHQPPDAPQPRTDP